MQAAIITVGDELLAGDVVNTNASWLATELAERGVSVREIVTIPDEIEIIAERVRRFSEAFDAVIVTGGVGGTPDDITMDAVAAAFDQELAVREEVRQDLIEYSSDPDNLDLEAWSALPVDARPLLNPEGLSPGCVMENVYVFPGIPPEMKAMFGIVADEFSGELHTFTTETSRPESTIIDDLKQAQEEFEVSVGSYPDPEHGDKTVKVTGGDEERAREARDWLAERLS